jgi:replicative DNA helicase
VVYTVVNTSNNKEETSKASAPAKSGAGFWNIDLELQAIKTVLTPTSEWAAKVYSACRPELFHHSTTKAIFTRLHAMMESSKSFELPTLDFVLSDSKITPSVRETLREALEGSKDSSPVAIVQSQGDYDLLVQGLTSLAKTRALYQATHKAANELLDSAEPTDLVKDVTNRLGESLFNMEDNDDILSQITMGRGYNQSAEDAFNRIVNGAFEDAKVKTGYKEFDERTGGFYRSNLVIIGAGSGHGKSLLAVNLLERQYKLGYNTILASYEMTDEEVLIRLLSCISEVDMNKIQNNQLTPPETHRVTAAWREFNLLGYEKGKTYNILAPKTETTVPEIGFRVRSMKPDVLILDYINLLGSASGTAEAQWQVLGDISREAKLLANKLNCVVILLAQIDDTYNLRYSKGIKDHANFVMGFIRDETAVNTRIINIHQMKARNAPLYNFDLKERFDIAQFRDPDQVDRAIWPTQDELLMLELKCQSVGLKLEPTASKEFDKKNQVKAKQLVNNISNEKIPDKLEDKPKVEMIPNSLLFSSEDAIPVDFSKLQVKASPISLLQDNNLYEGTV